MKSFLEFVTVHYSDRAGHFCRPLYVAVESGLSHHPLSRSDPSSLYTFLTSQAWLGIDSFELSTEFGSCSRAITRSSYRSIVLRSILGVLAQEDAENRVISEDVSVVVRVPTDGHRGGR